MPNVVVDWHKSMPKYESNLHYILAVRQILLFFAPLAISTVILGVSTTYQQLTTLIVFGLSINIFWVVYLPLLTKAHFEIDFRVDNAKDFSPKLTIEANTEQIIQTRIYNLGFSTLKNASIVIYFGKKFEILPFSDAKYIDIDFKKEFTVQKESGGAIFRPNKNFQTILPQMWLTFPVVVKVPNFEAPSKVIILVSSENSWGLTRYMAPLIITKKQ